MFRLSAHQLDRRPEKLEAMQDASKTHNILIQSAMTRLVIRSSVVGPSTWNSLARRMQHPEAHRVRLESSLSPVVMINGLRLDGTLGEPGLKSFIIRATG
jgi:hypothetical protein